MTFIKLFLCLLCVSFQSAYAGVDHTATGIPIDTSWKAKEYDYALKSVVHPSWGIAHSERDYQVAKKLADDGHIAMDLDVLFATAFLHDLGGIEPFAKPGVDHAVRSAELAEPLLRDWGFPMQKWSDVKEMILGHTYYGPVPISPQAFAFRDADILDFLGYIGAARILAITEEPGRASTVLGPLVMQIQEFERDLPGKLSSNVAQRYSKERVTELDEFLRKLNAETFGGNAL